jgi:4-coumarate--CoA ligase
MSSDDVVLGLLPAFHIYAMTVVFKTALSVGATVVTLPKFDPETFLGTIGKHRVTWAPLVPPLVLFLAKHPVVEKADLSSLRIIFSGAAPLDAETQAAVEGRLPHVSVRQGYGMTELSPVSHFVHPEHNHPGSVGFLAPNCEAKLILEDGSEAAAGEIGELCVRGPNVMLGYLNNDEATRSTILPDGFLRTGDIARINESGHTFIVDRLKELIKVKGYQVAPAELEGLLLAHTSLADAAVIGMPHERDGERPWAYVVRAPTDAGAALTDEDVKSYVAEETVDYKHLDRVVFVEAIPKSASGKILRRELKAAAVAEAEAASRA